MPMRPEELSLSALPKTPFGGVKADAVADLLERAARELLELLARDKELTTKVGELELVKQALELQVASLEEAASGHREPDEIARALLSSAQRAAREQREEVRREGELALKKARERATEIEGDVRKRAETALAELAALEAMRDAVARDLRRVLEAIAVLGSETSRDAEDGAGEGGPSGVAEAALAPASHRPDR